MLVNKHNVRDALEPILIHCFRFVSGEIVFDWGPSSADDMRLHGCHWAINTDPNNADTVASLFIMPLLSVFSHHVLVVSHWLLARWTPSRPKINQKYITFLVFYRLPAWYHRIWFFTFSEWDLLQAVNCHKSLVLIRHNKILLPQSDLPLLEVLTSLEPHVAVEGREPKNVSEWNDNHDCCLIMEWHVQFVWHGNRTPPGSEWVILGNFRKMLPSFEAGDELSSDSNWVQNNEESVS